MYSLLPGVRTPSPLVPNHDDLWLSGSNNEHLGYAGGQWNITAYCDNDPVNRVDPSGLAWQWWSSGGAAISAAGACSYALKNPDPYVGKVQKIETIAEAIRGEKTFNPKSPHYLVIFIRDNFDSGTGDTRSLARGSHAFLGIINAQTNDVQAWGFYSTGDQAIADEIREPVEGIMLKETEQNNTYDYAFAINITLRDDTLSIIKKLNTNKGVPRKFSAFDSNCTRSVVDKIEEMKLPGISDEKVNKINSIRNFFKIANMEKWGVKASGTQSRGTEHKEIYSPHALKLFLEQHKKQWGENLKIYVDTDGKPGEPSK